MEDKLNELRLKHPKLTFDECMNIVNNPSEIVPLKFEERNKESMIPSHGDFVQAKFKKVELPVNNATKVITTKSIDPFVNITTGNPFISAFGLPSGLDSNIKQL